MEQRQMQEMKADLSPQGFTKNPERRALIERWNKWIPSRNAQGQEVRMNDYNKYVISRLFENQLSELKQFKEKHALGEDTTTANTAPFIKYTFPLLRRVWPSLIAPEIVSVQPMNSPVGAVFYFELKYGNSKGQVTAGNRLVKDFNRNYSSQYIDGETVGTSNGSTAAFTYTTQWNPIIGQSLTVTAGTVIGTDDGNGNITGTGVSGTVNYNTGAIALTFGTAPVTGTNPIVTYQYNQEGNNEVPSVYIDISLVAVQANTRKLKALWSSESADDLRSLHGVDAEQELVAGLGSELALEIDREILTDIQNGATGAQATFDMTIPSGITDIQHIRSILTSFTMISNQIGKNTLRGPANWIVMSYDLAAQVEQLSTDGFFRPIFAGNTGAFEPAESPQTYGMMKMGTIQQRYVAYKDPYMAPNVALMGYKGNSFVDSGYVWAPYVPLQVTATFLDPNDFRNRKGMRTRYAKLMARSEYFGKLNVSNLNTLSPGPFGPADMNAVQGVNTFTANDGIGNAPAGQFNPY